MSTDRTMDKQTVVYKYNGILYSFKKKKKILSHAITQMNFEDIRPSKIGNKKTNTV